MDVRTLVTVIAPLALHHIVVFACDACDRANSTLIKDGFTPAALRDSELILEEQPSVHMQVFAKVVKHTFSVSFARAASAITV